MLLTTILEEQTSSASKLDDIFHLKTLDDELMRLYDVRGYTHARSTASFDIKSSRTSGSRCSE